MWQGWESTFIGRKRSWEGSTGQSPWFFIGCILARKEEEPFFFLWVSAVITGLESSPFLSPDSLFNWGFCLLIFYCPEYTYLLVALYITHTSLWRRKCPTLASTKRHFGVTVKDMRRKPRLSAPPVTSCVTDCGQVIWPSSALIFPFCKVRIIIVPIS